MVFLQYKKPTMSIISLLGKSKELTRILKETFGKDAYIQRISGEDLFYSDGDAIYYEFKVVQGSNSAYVGAYGFLVSTLDEPFRLAIKNWYDKYVPVNKVLDEEY